MAPNASASTASDVASSTGSVSWTEGDLRTALDRLHDVPFLQTHPLARHLMAESGDVGSVGRAVRRRLLESIDAMGVPDRVDRPPGIAHRLLVLRYVEGLAPAAVWAQLGLSRTAYYLEQARAVAAVASFLRQSFSRAAMPPRPESGRQPLPPPGPTSFVGRDAEMTDLRRLLGGGRLVTLTGPGGSGKTRLALEVARQWQNTRLCRVTFVPLAALTGPAEVLPAIGSAVGLPEAPQLPLADAIQRHLGADDTLLILDNVEHLLGAAPEIGAVLVGAPALRILATSREPLGIVGEREYALESLAAPATGDMSAVDAAAYPAMRLFADRATAVDARFEIGSDLDIVAEVCRRCDGMPLAIELAAARVRTFTPRALLARLGHALDLLSTGEHGVDPRHRTLRAAIDWSFNLLSPEDRQLFRGIGVFAGGCRLEAVEVILGTSHVGEQSGLPRVWEGIESLRRKSLLDRTIDADGEPRFLLLETVRTYALDAMSAAGEADAIRARHAAYFLALVEDGATWLGPLYEDADRITRLYREHNNVLAALRFFITTGDAQASLRLVGAFGPVWHSQCYLDEGQSHIEEALGLPGAAEPTAARASALTALGYLARRRTDYLTARRLFEEGLALWRGLGEAKAAAALLSQLANVAYQERLPDDASALVDEAMSMVDPQRDEPVRGLASMVLGQVALLRRDYSAARRLFASALGLSRQGRFPRLTGYLLEPLGMVALAQGMVEEAQAYFVESAATAQSFGDHALIAHVLDGFAGVAAAQGNPDDAVRLFAAAEALRERLGSPRSPASIELIEPWLSTARASLSAGDLDAAIAEGRAMRVEHALNQALGPASGRQRSAEGPHKPPPAPVQWSAS